MQKQSWSISSKDHINYEDADEEPGNNSMNQINEEPDEEEEEQQTLKPANTFKAARQTMIDRKLHEADIRGQLSK
jgi:hypothetical protein